MPITSLIIALSFVLSAGATSAPTSISWDDPTRWEFTGSLSFPVETLRRSLEADVDVLLASRGDIVPPQFAELLARRLSQGYLAAGFRDARVQHGIVQARQRIVLDIHEGPRWQRGTIQVVGARTIPVAALVQALTTRMPGKGAFPRIVEQTGPPRISWFKSDGQPADWDDPAWKVGDSVNFTMTGDPIDRQRVVLALTRLGYPEVSLTLRQEIYEDHTATLVVEILDEGPRAVVDDIEIRGVSAEVAERLRQDFDLRETTVFDAETQARLAWRLKESGRFTDVKVELVPPPFGEGPCRLIVAVDPFDGLPAYGEEPTALQAAALRAGRWLSSIRDRDWSLRVRGGLGPNESAVLPAALRHARGVQVSGIVSMTKKSGLLGVNFIDEQGQSLAEYRAQFTETGAIWLCAHRGAYFRTVMPDVRGSVQCQWVVQRPDEEGRRTRFNFGLGVHGGREPAERPPVIDVQISPLVILAAMLRSEVSASIVEDVLQIRGEGVTYDFQAETGELLKFHSLDETGLEIDFRAGSGLYEQAEPHFHERLAAARNVARPQAPWSSHLQFLCDEALWLAKSDQQPAPSGLLALKAILDQGGLQPLDEWELSRGEKGHGDQSLPGHFWIPPSEPDLTRHPLAWLQPVVQMCLVPYGACFPRDTAAWIVGREAAVTVLTPRHATGSLALIQQLDEAEGGPLTFLLAAELFRSVNPATAAVLARAGLERNHPERLISDLRVLADDRSFLGQMTRRIVEPLRHVEPGILTAAAAGWMTPEQLADLKPALELWSEQRDKPLSDFLPEVFARGGSPFLQPLLVRELERLANP